MGTTLRVLRRPAQETQAVALHAPTAAFELSGLQESAASLPAVYPQSLQAGWAFVPGQEKWKLWHEQVRVHSELRTASPENSPWLLNPAHASDLPDHLHLTPINKHRSLQTAVIPNDDPVQLADPNRTSIPLRVDSRHRSFVDAAFATNRITIKIAPKTGLITGSFRISEPHPFPINPNRIPALTRTGSFRALLIRDATGLSARGFFLLAQLPTELNQKAAAIPMLSGQIQLAPTN
jgi:hypothetical protein